jgi:hypothetical protein
VVVLAGFLVANTLHAINHGIDLALGGRVGDLPGLASFSVLAVVALYLRVRQLRAVHQRPAERQQLLNSQPDPH